MKNESAVHFATHSRIHLGLAVKDLATSVAFYRVLFGQEPTKTRPGYAKFEVAEPPVNLSLSEVGGETAPSNPVAHFGIQVKSTEAVQGVADRLAQAGLATKAEENVTCCYAVQTKVWAADPDGNKWETYVLLDNNAPHRASPQGDCCPNMAAVRQAVERGDLPAAMAVLEKAAAAPAPPQAEATSACGCSK